MFLFLVNKAQQTCSDADSRAPAAQSKGNVTRSLQMLMSGFCSVCFLVVFALPRSKWKAQRFVSAGLCESDTSVIAIWCQ